MNLQMAVSLLSDLRQFRRRDYWTPEQLSAYQTEALRGLRDYAYAHSPFYQRFHRGLTDAPLYELPVLTTAMLMEHFDELVTDRAIRLAEVKALISDRALDNRYLGRYWANATSGTSGHQAIFLYSPAEWIRILAAFGRAFRWGGIKLDLFHRVKMAAVSSHDPFHMSMRLNATGRNWLMPMIRISASERVSTIVERLNAWQPEVLIAYASIAGLLADEQRASRLHIAPRAVFTGKEVLTNETRRRIVQAWGEHLYDHYSATECGNLAAECAHHRGMHLMEDLVIFEVVDHNNRPVPPGVLGHKLLITVFGSRTQPLIRYQLDDRVRLATDPCPCGSPFRLLDNIEGRAEDILSFPGMSGELVDVHPLLWEHILVPLPVSRWQVIQEKDGLHVLLSGIHGSFDDERLVGTIQHALFEQGVIVPPIMVQRVSSIPQTAGKVPLVKNNLRQAEIPRSRTLDSEMA